VRIDNAAPRRILTSMKRMSLKEFGKIVRQVMDTLPESFRPFLKNLVVDIEDEPDLELLKAQGFSDEDIAEGDTLYGLFAPFPLAGDVDFGGVDEHDQPFHRIIIYKHPLEDDFPDPRDLRLEIRKTVIHELAHHFGYTERDLDPFESKEDPFGDET
jgi:predicted Zn-dependent protease with MMP-like domain